MKLKQLFSSRYTMLKLVSLSAVATFTFRYMYSPSSPSTLFAKQSYSVKKTPATNEKLVGVILLTRHGARTPLHILSGLEEAEYKPEWLDPFVKAKFKLKTLNNTDLSHDILSIYDKKNNDSPLKGGVGRGQLTNVGEKQMFSLGRRLQQRYVDDLKFISSEYNPNEIYTRSSHYKRTIHSAKSVLAGMFLNSHDTSNNDEFIINVHELHEDLLFPNSLNCPYYAEMFVNKLKIFANNKDYMKNLVELNKALSFHNIGQDIHFTSFRDDMVARKAHGLLVPDHLKELVIKSERYANIELSMFVEHNVKVSCGKLLSLIRENILSSVESNKLNKNDIHKFRYYSVHDSTINALLVAFGLINDDNHAWPPFAADLIIELWSRNENNSRNSTNKNKPEYFVNVLYLGELVKLPECKQIDCELNEFKNVLEKHSIDHHEFTKLCNQKFIA